MKGGQMTGPSDDREATRRQAFLRLGQLLARLRESRGWEIVDLAARAKVSYAQIYRIERGDFQTAPAFDNLVKIGAALGLSPNDLAKELGLWQDAAPPDLTHPVLAGLADYLQHQPPERRQQLLDFLSVWLRVERARAAP